MKFKIPKYTTSDGKRLDCPTVFFQRETGEVNHKIRRRILEVVMVVDWTIPGVELDDRNIRRHPRSRNQHITPDQLTKEELDQWRQWKIKHDIEYFVGGDLANYQSTTKSLALNLKKASTAIHRNIVQLTNEEVFELWSGIDQLTSALEIAGLAMRDLPSKLQQKARFGFKYEYLPLTSFSLEKIEQKGSDVYSEYEEALQKYKSQKKLHEIPEMIE